MFCSFATSGNQVCYILLQQCSTYCSNINAVNFGRFKDKLGDRELQI